MVSPPDFGQDHLANFSGTQSLESRLQATWGDIAFEKEKRSAEAFDSNARH
jgi:hypothetical protein